MIDLTKDTFCLGGHEFQSRFILGSGKYSLELIKAAVENAGAQIITLALRRTNQDSSASILDYIPEGVTLLPNTSGSKTAEEAVRIARLSREICHSDFVKLEVIPDSKILLPDNYETIKATEILANEGFIVMPYMYPDLNAARDLVNAGAACVMPLGAPIGSNKGICTKEFIQILIDEIDLPIIVDAGIGRPSHACEAMGMRCCSHVQYRYRYSRRHSRNGRRFPQSNRSRTYCIPFRHGTGNRKASPAPPPRLQE